MAVRLALSAGILLGFAALAGAFALLGDPAPGLLLALALGAAVSNLVLWTAAGRPRG